MHRDAADDHSAPDDCTAANDDNVATNDDDDRNNNSTDDDNDHNGATDDDNNSATDDDNDHNDHNDHNDDDDDDHDDDTPPPTLGTFTDLHDLVPHRCYVAATSTVVADSVVIGIENGGAVPGTFQRKACIAATTAFNPASVGDTFTVTVTAPPGMTISRVQYVQVGSRLLERSTYWRASGTGELTAGGVSVPFSFTTPSLGRSIDLTGQNVASTTISVSISMSAGRSANQPRVTNPPGSASISVTSARIIVEYA